MMGFGLLSVVVAAFLLSRQKDVKRLFAYSSIEHMGIITFAFGMGGAVANFAALLHMTVHSLTKIRDLLRRRPRDAEGRARRSMDDIRGTRSRSAPSSAGGWCWERSPFSGMPPFGVFASEFLILITAMREQPWATPFLLLALGVAFAAGVLEGAADGVRRDHAQAPAASAGDDPGVRAPRARADAGPVDPAVPRRVVPAGGATHRLTREPWTSPASDSLPRRCLAAFPAQRVPVSSGQLLTACRLAWEGGGRLVALWVSDDRDRNRGFAVRVALEDADGLTVLEHTLPDAERRTIPTSRRSFPAANRMQRAAFDLTGIAADSDDQRQWLWQACWPIDRYPLRRDFEASPKWEPGEEDYGFVRVEGDGVHEIPVGPVHAGIIEPGHFRFQVVGEKVLRLEERLGYAHKGIEKRFESLAARRRVSPRGPRVGRQHRGLRLGVCAGRGSDRRA